MTCYKYLPITTNGRQLVPDMWRDTVHSWVSSHCEIANILGTFQNYHIKRLNTKMTFEIVWWLSDEPFNATLSAIIKMHNCYFCCAKKLYNSNFIGNIWKLVLSKAASTVKIRHVMAILCHKWCVSQLSGLHLVSFGLGPLLESAPSWMKQELEAPLKIKVQL